MNDDEIKLAIRNNLTLHWIENRLSKSEMLNKTHVKVKCSAKAKSCIMIQQLNSSSNQAEYLLTAFVKTNQANL